jgi:hypothetical protein
MAKEKKEDSAILHNIASHLSQNMPKPSESPEDLIKQQATNNAFNRMKNTKVVADGKPMETRTDMELPKPAAQVYPMPLGGYKIPMVGIPTVDMNVILTTILCLESDHNPRIRAWLKEANFSMQDMDGKQIFPRKEKKKRKKRARSKKR